MVTEADVATLVEAAGGRGRHVDEDRVARYMQIFDDLPPIVAFDTESGLVLADGYHRLAAAVRLGRTVVPVDLRRGTRQDALAFAVAQAAEDRGVTSDQARAAIHRWSQPDDPSQA